MNICVQDKIPHFMWQKTWKRGMKRISEVSLAVVFLGGLSDESDR